MYEKKIIFLDLKYYIYKKKITQIKIKNNKLLRDMNDR